MAKLSSIKPIWVLVDKHLREVSEFAHLPRNQRPDASCPACQRPIIFKLGNYRVHHYAHRPEDVCAANQPETALHLNTKFYIYKQLLQARTVYIEESCARYCGEKRTQVWLEKWDSVNVEFTVDSFRPDIALLSEGKVIGAIEVLVSHSVSEQKAQYFADQRISWLEVQANETLYEGDNTWTPEKPLAFYHCYPQFEHWICESCSKIEEKQRVQRAYEQKNYVTIHSAKMVDFYFKKSGKKFRGVYFVLKKVQDNSWDKAWVKTETNRVIASENGPITKESLKRLNEAVRKDITQFEVKGAIIDEVVKWRLWETGQKFVARDTDNYPFRYVWNEEQSKWDIY